MLGIFVGLFTAFGASCIMVCDRKLNSVNTWVMLFWQASVGWCLYTSLIVFVKESTDKLISMESRTYGFLFLAGIFNLTALFL
jgi:hypothetical protein